MSGTYNKLQIVQGQVFSVDAYRQESTTGIIAPLDGLKARITICYRDYDGEVAFEGTTEDGCISISSDIVTVIMTSEQTSLLRFDNIK